MGSRLNQLLEMVKGLGWGRALGISAALIVASLAFATVLVVHWPADKFKGAEGVRFWHTRHPVIRVAGLVAKNAAGYLIILLGMVMAVPGVPGQGALLILIGLTLIDFPGKRNLEGRLIRRPPVRRVVNSLRRRFGRPPLDLD